MYLKSENKTQEFDNILKNSTRTCAVLHLALFIGN